MSCHLLHGQSKQSEILVPLKALGVTESQNQSGTSIFLQILISWLLVWAVGLLPAVGWWYFQAWWMKLCAHLCMWGIFQKILHKLRMGWLCHVCI